MSKPVSKSDIYDVISALRHPEFEQMNLLELGMVPDVEVKDDRVEVTLALPSLDVPIRQPLVDAVRRSVSSLREDPLDVEVVVVEMDAGKREAFKTMVGKAKQRPRVDRRIDNVIAVMSGKGGVGKSSVAVLLASALERRGCRVGVLDADITGPSIPKMLGAQHPPTSDPEGILPVQSQTGIKIMSINLLLPDTDQPVVWRGPLISRAIEQFWRDILWGDLDFLIVDLPPGTADAALTVMQSLPLDGVVLVTSPQDLAGMVVRKAANMAIHLGIRLIGLIENMSHAICPECGAQIDIFGRSRANETVRLIGIPFLGRLPLDAEISRLCDRGDIERYHGDAFDEIVDRVMGVLSVEIKE
jgi:Mrp family chromosome partitioning ATPase